MQYENLEIWKRSKLLAIDVFRSTNHIQDYGFRDQITRSVLSVPSNIAEGMERSSLPDKARFLVIAKGSVGEFKTQTDIGIAINYINQKQGLHWMAEAESLSKMIGSFIQRLKTS